MREQICHIVGAGEFCPVFRRHPGDYVIAADGGLRHLSGMGFKADLLIGDFDSLSGPPDTPIKVVTLPKEKDDTDMLAAVRIGLKKGYRRFHLYGGTGGRLDHTLANIQCLSFLADQGARGVLFDRQFLLSVIRNDSLRFDRKQRGYVSAFSLSDRSEGVWEKGLRYPLENATLTNAFPLGVSNQFTGEKSEISVGQGTLLILWQRESEEP